MAVLVSDSFNRGDSNTTLGTTDSAYGGTAKTWETFNGAWGINNNRAVAISNTDPNGAVVDVGQANASVQVKIAIKNDSYACAVRVDTVAKTGIIFHAGSQRIQTFSGNTYTTLGTATPTINANDIIKLVAQGSTITVFQNGTQILSVTTSFNQTLTKHGLTNWQTSGVNGVNGAWDDVIIEDLATGGTGTSGSISYATKQSIYQTSSVALATKQIINRLGATAYATQQTITDGGIPGATSYSTKQIIYQVSSAQMATKQAIYRTGSSQWATLQSIMDFVQILRKIRLKGERRMKIKLLGSRQLVVQLKGELPLAKKNQNFEIDVGDSGDIEITATDTGTPINLSGATIQWEMRNGPEGPLLLSKSTSSGVTITNSSGGVFEVRLNSADTAKVRAGRYYHEAKIIDATGFVSTVTKGEATFVN